MLAKMWKKILLAVCIVACIFNLMSKLVNRHSLESNLQTANDGETVLEAIKEQKAKETVEQENLENGAVEESEENLVAEEDAQITENETEEQTEEGSEKNKTYRYTDFTITF